MHTALVSGFSAELAGALLDHVFRDPVYTPPPTLYAGLSSTAPTDTGGNITEPTDGGYARAPTTGADWGAASGTVPVTKANTSAVAWPTATGAWLGGVNLAHVVIFDELDGGSMLLFGRLAVARPVLAGDTPVAQPGSIVITLGAPVGT